MHSLCTPCSLLVHSLCTPGALRVHSLCTPCALLVHSLCTPCALLVHSLCTPCALLVHSLCTPCALLVATRAHYPVPHANPSLVRLNRSHLLPYRCCYNLMQPHATAGWPARWLFTVPTSKPLLPPCNLMQAPPIPHATSCKPLPFPITALSR